MICVNRDFEMQESLLGVHHLAFVVQSSRVEPEEVSRRVLTFVAGAPELVRNTTAEDFSSYKAAARQRLLEPPRRLSQVSSELWGRISERTYDFDRAKRVGHAVERVTASEVVELARQLLRPEVSGSLLIQVHGQKHPLTGVAPDGFSTVKSATAFRAKASFWPPSKQVDSAAPAASASAPSAASAEIRL